MTLELMAPNANYCEQYLKAEDDGLLFHEFDTEERDLMRRDFPAWLEWRTDVSRPVELPDGSMVPRVPESYFWAVDKERFIGTLSIRHELTPFLREAGGHVGYAVAKDERRKGYGAQILALGLEEARKIGLCRILVTCSEINRGSERIIKKNGGEFDSYAADPFEGRASRMKRFWIRL